MKVHFGSEEGKERAMKSALWPLKISIYISCVYPSSSFKACFLWFLFNFFSFDAKFRLRKKLGRSTTVAYGFHFLPRLSREPNEKFLHGSAINKQMDRNNHRMEGKFAMLE